MSQTPGARQIARIAGESESERIPAMAGQIARSFGPYFQKAGSAPRLLPARAVERNPFAKVFRPCQRPSLI